MNNEQKTNDKISKKIARRLWWKHHKVFFINYSIATICLLLGLVGSMYLVFNIKWTKEKLEFENVSCDIDDESFRYDIYIEDIGHLYIPVSSAKWFYEHGDSIQNYVVVSYSENILKNKNKYSIQSFWINVGYAEECECEY